MEQLLQLDVEKYIEWYKHWTKLIAKFQENSKRLTKLIKVADYLEERIFKGISSGISEKYMNHFDNEAEKLKIEISPYTSYAVDYANGNDNLAFMIPSKEDFELLYEIRDVRLRIAKAGFLRDCAGSANEKLLTQQKLDQILKKVNDTQFSKFAIRGIPIPNVVKTELSQDIFSEASKNVWRKFCFWIHDVDFCKWLNQKINDAEELPFLKTAYPQLKWEAPDNVLYTLFFDLLQQKVITWNGKGPKGEKMEIARMITTFFVNKEGDELSIETIKQTLKPGTAKSKKKIDISPILSLKKINKKF